MVQNYDNMASGVLILSRFCKVMLLDVINNFNIEIQRICDGLQNRMHLLHLDSTKPHQPCMYVVTRYFSTFYNFNLACFMFQTFQWGPNLKRFMFAI